MVGPASNGNHQSLHEAHSAGLRYASDRQPGIRRRKQGEGFTYTAPRGGSLRDRQDLARIKSLAIPPAWTDVWISPDARGHVQATGRDARGRKQYRYHREWRSHRDSGKFERLTSFARRLPALRRRLADDEQLAGLPREKVIATVVRLLESTLIRVGNDEYARDNGSFGLTTLRTRHASVDGASIIFRFIGKGGKQHRISLRSRKLAGIVRRCRELPGQDLFQYLTEDGTPQTIGSSDVNDYLRAAMGDEFTAKDFRTWQATVLAASELARAEPAGSAADAKRAVGCAIAATAEALGNTPAICRKCYVHPDVIAAYERGATINDVNEADDRTGLTALSPRERAVLRLLERMREEQSTPELRRRTARAPRSSARAERARGERARGERLAARVARSA